jgi:hypothetical protein
VLDGKVDLSTEFPSGKDETWMSVGNGFLLCWSSVIEPYRYTCSGHAVGSVRLLKLDGLELHEMMEKDHDLGYTLMKHIAIAISERLHATRTMFISMIPTS